MNDGELSAVLSYEIQQAQGYDSDVLASKRQVALEYYQGIMPDPAEGRNTIVSKDVGDAVHSLLAQIQPIMRTTTLEFVPEGDEDEMQAQTESDFTSDAMEKAGGWTTIFEATHDALLMGNGWMKISTKDDVKVTEEEYPADLPDEALFMLAQPTAENQVVKISAGTSSTMVKRTTTTTKLEFECVPPEDMLFSEGRGVQSLQEQRFIAQRKLYTASTLKEMGISEQTISELPEGDDDYWPAVNARQGIYGNDDGRAAQESERLKLVYCCYINMSSGDNYESELRYVWYSGGHILKNEPADWVPYVTGSPLPMPHRVQGQGMFEQLASIQEGKTHVLRNYMDNLDVMNSSRMGVVEGQVNMADATSGRVNGLIRMRSPDAIVPIPSNDVGAQAIQGMQYLDEMTTQRIGSSLDMNEAEAQIMKSSATAAAGQLGQTEKMGGFYATNLVEGMLKPAYMAVHRLLRTEIAGPIMAKSRSQWTEQDTSQWVERDIVHVTMGMTTADKAHTINTTSQIVQLQTQLAMQGGIGTLVGPSQLYNAATDWMRASDIEEPSQYLIDPDSPEAQQAREQQAMQQEQQQQQMMQMQQQMEQIARQHELLMQENELKYKYYDTNLDAEVEEAKITSSAVTDMAKVRQQEASSAKADNG